MKLILLILFIPFASGPIRYKQLTWTDFKGIPTSDHLASTCSGIVIEKDTAYAVFEPDKSWTRTNSVATLRHEQLHFDITDRFAKQISMRLKTKNWLNLDGWVDDWEEMETRYDKETDHGNDAEAQARWEREIKSKL